MVENNMSMNKDQKTKTMSIPMQKEWLDITQKLKSSGHDLSKIEIVPAYDNRLVKRSI